MRRHGQAPSVPSGVTILVGFMMFLLTTARTAPSLADPLPAKPVPDLVKDVRGAVFTIRTKDRNGADLAQGSGFVIGKDLVATNVHVLGGFASGVCALPNGDEFPILKVAVSNSDWDTAIVRIDTKGKELPALSLAVNEPPVGSEVIVIGSPKGLEQTVSTGIVSSYRALARRAQLLQFTAAVSPGSSGGPVFNRAGEVVAIVRAGIDHAQNLNFAVTASALQWQLDLASNKRVEEQTPDQFVFLELFEALPSRLLKRPKTLGEIRALIDELEKVINSKPYATDARLLLATLHCDQTFFQRLKTGKLFTDAEPVAAETVEKLRHHARMIKTYEKYAGVRDLQIAVSRASTLTSALSFKAINLPDEAIVLGKLAVSLDPKEPQSHAALARAYCASRKMDLAVASMKTAQELAPKDVELTTTAAFLYHELGDAASFKNACEKLRSLNERKLADGLEAAAERERAEAGVAPIRQR